jgi:hypothetical protein
MSSRAGQAAQPTSSATKSSYLEATMAKEPFTMTDITSTQHQVRIIHQLAQKFGCVVFTTPNLSFAGIFGAERVSKSARKKKRTPII